MELPQAGTGVVAPSPASAPPCRLAVHPWAEFFGLRRDVARTEAGRLKLCARVTNMIPSAARRGYQVGRVLSRGAYGIVFVAERGGGAPRRVALKLQFVCPKHMRRQERARCGGFGQRASLYETVRYEARTHAELFQVARAVQRGREAGAEAAFPESLFLPRVPEPIAASRLILGRRGEFPEVPPDGRRRLWVSLMEYVPHPSLRAAVLEARDRGALSAGNYLALVAGVARHLAGMHARYGYVHGDPHSGNFLVDLAAAADPSAAGWVYVIDLERAIPRTFLQLAPAPATTTPSAPALSRASRWRQLRLWDLKVFCESVVALAETARVWRPAAALDDPTTAASAAPSDLDRLRRGMLVAQTALDAYEQTWRDTAHAFGAAPAPLAAPLAPPRLLLAWVARALYLKHKPQGTIPPEVEAGPLAGLDVRATDRRAHRDFFDILRAAQSLALASARRRKRAPKPKARR